MATAQEVIKNFMKSLDETSLSGESAVDEAIQACSDFNSISDAISQMVSDCKNASSATAFLTDYCGIILDNDDTGAITGSDAGGSTTKTADSIVPENGSLTTYTNNSFTTNGLKVELVTFPDSDYENHGDLTQDLAGVRGGGCDGLADCLRGFCCNGFVVHRDTS